MTAGILDRIEISAQRAAKVGIVGAFDRAQAFKFAALDLQRKTGIGAADICQQPGAIIESHQKSFDKRAMGKPRDKLLCESR